MLKRPGREKAPKLSTVMLGRVLISQQVKKSELFQTCISVGQFGILPAISRGINKAEALNVGIIYQQEVFLCRTVEGNIIGVCFCAKVSSVCQTWDWTHDPGTASVLFLFVTATGNIHWTSGSSSVKFQHYNLLLHCSLLHILIIFLNFFFFLTLVCLKLESCLNV